MRISEKDFISVGSGQFYGTNLRNEADVAWKPLSARAANKWPTIVIEVSLSKSLSQLRKDFILLFIQSLSVFNLKIMTLFNNTNKLMLCL
jgi:hypothetical protein